MANWASDVAAEAVTGRKREPVEASRVALEVRGGPVVVQWSLSYQAYVVASGQAWDQSSTVQVRAMATLERDGLEIARWTLADDRAPGTRDRRMRLQVTGTTGGLFVDREPGVGPKTYVLKVWNETARRNSAITVSTRTMICEER